MMLDVEQANPESLPDARVLLFNLTTDANHPILAFTTSWISRLASRVGAVDVVTMRAGALNVPPNVRVFSVGKELGYSEVRRGINFYLILIRLLLRHRYAFAFAHMMPLFALMAAPLLKIWRTPLILWYAHSATPVLLRVVEKVVDRVISSSRHGFRVPTDKLIITGQGIDTKLFSPVLSDTDAGATTLVSVGRLSPVKRLEVLLDAMKVLVEGGESRLKLVVAGPRYDDDYARRLEEQVSRDRLDEVVRFVGHQRPDQVVDLLRRATLVVNVSDTDSMDKAILEAMSCSIPVVTANAAFEDVFDQLDIATFYVPKDSPAQLARAIKAAVNLDPKERREIGWRLRRYVVERHDLDGLIDALLLHARRL